MVFRGQTPVRLSPKEYNLLVYMTQHAERVISRMEIAENVWNTHFDTGTNFIDVYINYLRCSEIDIFLAITTTHQFLVIQNLAEIQCIQRLVDLLDRCQAALLQQRIDQHADVAK